jgi:hypothetical protein
MYKVVINTRRPKKVTISPLRIVEAEASSPTPNEKIANLEHSEAVLLTN